MLLWTEEGKRGEARRGEARRGEARRGEARRCAVFFWTIPEEGGDRGEPTMADLPVRNAFYDRDGACSLNYFLNDRVD